MAATFDLAGFLAPLWIYAAIFVLHLVVPARVVAGYVRDPETGAPLRYRLNGPAVLFGAVFAWVLVGELELAPWDWLYHHRLGSLAGACALGSGFSAWIVWRGRGQAKISGDSAPSIWAEFYLGRLDNPQFLGGRVDAKMFLYLVGAVMLELNLLAFASHHYMRYGAAASPGVGAYLAMFSFFVVDYLSFERVHLYTYDLFAERVGFKLGWGCLCFYPFFYPVGLWALADAPDPGRGTWWTAGSVLVFACGWVLARGANMQKFAFKTEPEKVFLGLIRPEVVSDGERALLCSGFWGLSRHINYLGEILMATGLALVLGRPDCVWVWLYPAYYLALLIPRERDDDRRCAAKYGPLWDAYRERVPHRIIPGIY
jgi:delta14-sterol reductase